MHLYDDGFIAFNTDALLSFSEKDFPELKGPIKEFALLLENAILLKIHEKRKQFSGL